MSAVRMIKDDVNKIFSRIQDLTHVQVLVGIPEDHDARDNPPGDEIGNAAAGYLNEHGYPPTNLPARPFLVPGVQAAESQVASNFKTAAVAALTGDKGKMDAQLTQAGMAAVRRVREAIQYGNFVPLAPTTIANRWRKRQGVQGAAQSMRKGEKKYLSLIDQGMSPAEAQVEAGIHPLMNTNQMFKAITFVLRSK